MDLEAIPTAVETRTEYDWMFGVPSREWKLVALLGVVYTRENIHSRYWISIQAIERCLREFGYQPVVALQRADQLLNTARYYQVLSDDPALMTLELLPRPLDAIAEFVGELSNFNMSAKTLSRVPPELALSTSASLTSQYSVNTC